MLEGEFDGVGWNGGRDWELRNSGVDVWILFDLNCLIWRRLDSLRTIAL